MNEWNTAEDFDLFSSVIIAPMSKKKKIFIKMNCPCPGLVQTCSSEVYVLVLGTSESTLQAGTTQTLTLMEKKALLNLPASTKAAEKL